MTFNAIVKVLDETGAGNVLLLCHHNSDPDAICSAFAFQGLLKKTRANLSVEIGSGGGVSKLAKNLFRYIPINVNLQPNVEKARVIILLDTNTIQQLDALADRVVKAKVPIIVVDHHIAHPETQKLCKLCITKEEAASTCEIVHDFYKEQNIKPDRDEARALFLGMAFDTRHFLLAKSTTFKAVAELVDSGVNSQEALAMLSLPMDLSERIARVKACQRANIVRIENWILAFSHVSAFEASAARAIIEIGAHVASVAGKKGDGIEISLRCTREFVDKTGIHLGRDIAKPVGEEFRGQGGGHAMAAGVNAKSDIKSGLKLCLQLLKESLAKSE